MVSQFLCLFATLFPILNHSSPDRAPRKCSRRWFRRVASLGSVSMMLAAGMVNAQTLPTVESEGVPFSEPLSDAIASDESLSEQADQKLSAASVSAERYRSVRSSGEGEAASVPASVPAYDAEQVLIQQMSQDFEEPAGEAAAVASAPVAKLLPTLRALSPASSQKVNPQRVSRPSLQSSTVQPLSDRSILLPPPPRPEASRNPDSVLIAPKVLVADKELQGQLGSVSLGASAPPSPAAVVVSQSARPTLPQVLPASPYPGYQQSYGVQPYGVQPGVVSQVPHAQPAYGVAPHVPAYPASTAVPVYPAPVYPAPVYPAPVYPQAGYPQAGYPPVGYPGYAAPGYPVPVAQPYYYVAYPVAGGGPVPVYAAPPQAPVAGGYPAPFIAPGYPAPQISPGYPAPYPVASPVPYPPTPQAVAETAPPAYSVPGYAAGYPAPGPSYAGGVAVTPPVFLPPPPGQFPLPPSLNAPGLGAGAPPTIAPTVPPVELPVVAPTPPAVPATPPLDPNPVLATPNGRVPALAEESFQAVGGPLDSPTAFSAPASGQPGTLPPVPEAQTQASLPQRQPGRLLRTSALSQPDYSFQGVFLAESDESSGRARLSTVYPLTPNLLFGGSFDVSSGDSFSVGETSGFSVNELYAAASIEQLPNLRFLVGQLDLTSYFDRNSFAKDSATHFFNTAFQTNPALSTAGIASRTGLLLNWTATDNIELKAAAFSSDNGLTGFALDGFAGEVGFRYGNAIIRGSFVSDRDAGNDDGFQEIFALARPDGGTGLRSGDREQGFGVNAEWFIPNLNVGLFGRYGRYENLELDEGGDTFSFGFNIQDLFSPDDRLGLAYGQNLSNDSLRRELDIEQAQDVLELFYDFRFLPNLRLGFSVQGRDRLSEAAAGFRLRADFDAKPSRTIEEVR